MRRQESKTLSGSVRNLPDRGAKDKCWEVVENNVSLKSGNFLTNFEKFSDI
jgi:hypothetical protein